MGVYIKGDVIVFGSNNIAIDSGAAGTIISAAVTTSYGISWGSVPTTGMYVTADVEATSGKVGICNRQNSDNAGVNSGSGN